jgi:hypothetical protein
MTGRLAQQPRCCIPRGVYHRAVPEFPRPRNHRRRLTFVLDHPPRCSSCGRRNLTRVVTPCQLIPHSFLPQECDSAVMDQEQNPLQRRKQQRIASNRRVKPPRHDRLTPTDLLKLIPSPIVLSDRSLAGYARRLEQRRERLQRLTARFAR